MAINECRQIRFISKKAQTQYVKEKLRIKDRLYVKAK